MSFNALRHNLASATTATKSIFDEGPDKAEDVDDEAEMPPSELDKLSPTEVSQIQTEIATEMYGFAPLTFTSRVVDLANDVIYRVIDKIEVEVNTRWAEGEGVDEETKQSVAKGVNRLETLLMGAVDVRFDQAETWLVRNTFKVPVELIPYILLPHHPPEGFQPYLHKGQDDALMKELERDIARVNGQREELVILSTVEERLRRRVEALRKVKSSLSELLAAGGTKDTLSAPSKALAVSVPSYVSQLRLLLNSYSRSGSRTVQDSESSSQEPWKHSREAYLDWMVQRATSSAAATSDASSAAQSTDSRVGSIMDQLDRQGRAKDANALRDLLQA